MFTPGSFPPNFLGGQAQLLVFLYFTLFSSCFSIFLIIFDFLNFLHFSSLFPHVLGFEPVSVPFLYFFFIILNSLCSEILFFFARSRGVDPIKVPRGRRPLENFGKLARGWSLPRGRGSGTIVMFFPGVPRV